GLPGMPIPPIMPGDSFVARFVPPRSGSFMYHTHVSDVNQQGKGLSGALLVVDDRSQYDPSHDRIFLAETDLEQPPMLNGQLDPAPDTVRAGETYRLRLMNITLGAPYLVFRFVTDSFPTAWTTIAKDGFDLPLRQQEAVPAVRPVSIGETMDVTWTARPGGSGWLEMRSEYGLLFRRQRIVVVAGEALPKGGN
ncbi:MAG: multicopper oxidase domain-containing protein, partial [Gemmatimonadota bacterium]